MFTSITEFFGKRGVMVGDDENIFNYITSPNVDDSNCTAVLEGILKAARRFEEFDVNNEVFRQTFIPKSMIEVPHFERDIKKAKRGKELIYTNLLGLKSDLSGPSDQVEMENVILDDLDKKEKEGKSSDEKQSPRKANQESLEEESTDETDTSTSESGDEGSKFVNAARPRHETPEEKRERKKAVKAEKAAKREQKIKKSIKKRSQKLAHANSKR